MRPGICVLGHFERDYPRNAVIRRWLEELGYRVVECRSTTPFPWRHIVLAAKYLSVHRQVEGVWAAEGGHRLVPLMSLVVRACGQRLIFDPFISRFDTRVNDRKLYRAGSLNAWIAWWQDWSSVASADHLVFDTAEHETYFREQYAPRSASTVLEVAVDETVFFPRPERQSNARTTKILFYGTFIPLHGVVTILDAAARLRDRPDLCWTLIGRGQDYAAMTAHAEDLQLPNVAFVEPMPPSQLAERIADADVCLGIFGTSRKAASVVPNKVVQCAAMQKPIVTRESSAVRRYFTHGRDVTLVPPGDASALANAVAELADNRDLRRGRAAAARTVFEASFSSSVLKPRLLQILRAGGLSTPLG